MNTIVSPTISAPATTIDEVILQLRAIINYCKCTHNRLGYFAILYCNVTRRVKRGIQRKEFDDNVFMEKMDVLFANHYINAWNEWQKGNEISQSWSTAFKAAVATPLVLLQHYMLGMNAHINLDLGIATVEALERKPLNSIRKDFDKINDLLGSMIDATKDRLEKINPLMYLLRLYKGDVDNLLVGFSINKAREGAWCFAENLFGKLERDYKSSVLNRDQLIAHLGNGIAYPKSNLLKSTLKSIRRFENEEVAKNIEALEIIDI